MISHIEVLLDDVFLPAFGSGDFAFRRDGPRANHGGDVGGGGTISSCGCVDCCGA